MTPDKVTIQRSIYGIFATAKVFFPTEAKEIAVTIWGKPGHISEEYANKTDDELKEIAANHWNKTWKDMPL